MTILISLILIIKFQPVGRNIVTNTSMHPVKKFIHSHEYLNQSSNSFLEQIFK